VSAIGSNAAKGVHDERPVGTYSGFLAVAIGLALLASAAWIFLDAVGSARALRAGVQLSPVLVALALGLAGALVLAGMYTLQPNEAAIIQLFGAYRGTTRRAPDDTASTRAAVTASIRRSTPTTTPSRSAPARLS